MLHNVALQGGSQHDAQEFLLWLLDRVHEELNTATKKKYKRLKDLPGRPDDANSKLAVCVLSTL